MKKSDYAMIILIASVSILVAYFIAKGVLGDMKEQTAKVKVAEPITAAVEDPDPRTFNSNAINPTIEVIIGSDSTQR
ncbi:MAG TPA: hypothetical protein VGO98_00700 [Candidatus Saccharimonadales bacterium]|jgi:hypothetical protein|nr:hypothetical protein [Candidatus Saccharimonadales bacterium]